MTGSERAAELPEWRRWAGVVTTVVLAAGAAIYLDNKFPHNPEQKKAVVIGLTSVISVLATVVSAPFGGGSGRYSPPGQAQATVDWDTGYPSRRNGELPRCPSSDRLYKEALEAGAPLLVRTTPNWKAGTLSGLLRRAAHDGLAPLLTTTRELQDHGGRVDRLWRERIHLPWRRFLVPRPYRVFVVVNADSWSDSPQTKQLHWHLSRWLAEWPGSAVAVVVNAADQDDAPVGTQMSMSETSSVGTAATDKELREALGLSSTPEDKDLVSAVALLNGRSFHRFEMPLRLYSSRRSLWVAALRVTLPLLPAYLITGPILAIAAAQVYPDQSHSGLTLVAGGLVGGAFLGAVLPGFATVMALTLTWPGHSGEHELARLCGQAALVVLPAVLLEVATHSREYIGQLWFGVVLAAYVIVYLSARRAGGLWSWVQQRPADVSAGAAVWLAWLAVPYYPSAAYKGSGLLLALALPAVFALHPRLRLVGAVALLVPAVYLVSASSQSATASQSLRTVPPVVALLLFAALVGSARLRCGDASTRATRVVLGLTLLLPLLPEAVVRLKVMAESRHVPISVASFDVASIDLVLRLTTIVFVAQVMFQACRPRRSPPIYVTLTLVVAVLLALSTDTELIPHAAAAYPLDVVLVLLCSGLLVTEANGLHLREILRAGAVVGASYVLSAVAAGVTVTVLARWIIRPQLMLEGTQVPLGYRPETHALMLVTTTLGATLALVLLAGFIIRSSSRLAVGAATVSSGAAAVIGVTAGVAVAVMVRLSDSEIHWQRVSEAVVPVAALLGAWAVIRWRYPAGSLSPVALVVGMGGLLIWDSTGPAVIALALLILGGPAESVYRQVRRPNRDAFGFAVVVPLLVGLVQWAEGPRDWTGILVSALPFAFLALLVTPADPALVPWSVTRDRHLRLRLMTYLLAGVFGTLLWAIRAASLPPTKDLPAAVYNGSVSLLIALSFATIVTGWVSAGWFVTSAGNLVESSRLLKLKQVRWARLLNTLSEHGWVRLDGERVQVIGTPDQ